MSCIFCRIIKGEIPSYKLLETERSFSFLDIGPLSEGHALVISKEHAQFMHELSDESLQDILPVAKRVAKAINADNYNILQVVDHVHFHIIPKPNAEEGLGIGWPTKPADNDKLQALAEKIRQKL